MFGLANNILGYFFKQPEILPLEEALEILQKSDEDETKPDPEIPENQANECFKGVGKLTYMDEHYGMIDTNLFFENCTLALEVGANVSYLAYTCDGQTKISKVLGEFNSEWETVDNEKHFWCRRKIIGKVIERNEREVIVEPGDVRCDLNKVESEFVPVVGDWIELESLVEIDENVSDLSGAILEVTKISPLRPKIIQGVIRKWSEQLMLGVINADVCFTKDACIPGYMPVSGDKVVAEVIESDQRRCVWRALKVVPQDDRTAKHTSDVTEQNIANLLENKNGIIVTDNITISLINIGTESTFAIEVTNTANTTHKIIDGYSKSNQTEQSQIKLESPDFEKEILLEYNQTVIFRFLCSSKFMGTTKELYIFKFEDFEIGRWISIEIKSEFDSKTKPFTDPKNRSGVMKNARISMLNVNKDVLLGQKPVRPPSFIANKLPMYDIPRRITESLFTQMEKHSYISQIPIEKVTPNLLTKLSIQSYPDRFHTLVYLEELSLQINMHKYDMERARFSKQGDFLMLEVPDLNERRPSVILGDRVMVTDPTNPATAKIEGFVHKTGSRHVYIKFHPNFHEIYKGEDYTVEFLSSRTNFRRYHQAIDLAVRNLGKDFLFPSGVKLKAPQLIFKCAEDNKSEGTRKSLSGHMKPSVSFSSEVADLEETSKKENIKPLNNFESSTPKQDKTENKNESSYVRMARSALRQKQRSSLSPDEKKSDISILKTNICPVKLQWFDKKLNFYQKNAVKNILEGKARPLPYFIFGPPGTGKTVTLIETILQITRLIPHSRLLVVAPSNSAADLLALHLLDSGVLLPGDLVRMVAFRCVAEGSIPHRLVPYCVTGDIAREGSRESKLSNQNGVKIGVQASVLGRHRITVGTCMVVGNIYTMGFPRGHFTHILIDEAGQATEPEVLIPLALLDVTSAQTILAGDPLQLGPCVFSRLSEAHGLSESFFERLINRFPYVRDPVGFPETGGYDPRLVTRLVYNYRSLPEILALPNMLFYDSELQATISSENSSEVELLRELSEILPKRLRGHPPAIVFHGVRGENFQTVDSPSWFNPAEAGQVFFYVNDLYRLGHTSKDIGVITPYIKQGQQVRALFNEVNLPMPKVGSVEEFQGQEFKIIILTTVRSNESGAKSDARYGLGFMASPRRLNVAITRAQALLIIVGNPHLLCTDNYWRSVLSYAIKIGGYRGCDLPNLSL